MSEILFVRILTSEFSLGLDSEVRWILCGAHGERLAQSKGSPLLREVVASLPPAGLADRDLVILLPGHSVFVGETTIAHKSARHLHTALALAVEDQLAEPTEEAHVAVGENATESTAGITYRVVAIRDAWMRELMDALAAAEFDPPKMVTSEALLIPYEDGRAVLLLGSDSVVFRLAPEIASSLEVETFLIFLEAYMAKDTDFGTIELWATEQDCVQHGEALDKMKALCHAHNIELHVQRLEDSPFAWLCNRYMAFPEASRPINLLQGPYRIKRDFHFSIPHKKWVVAVVAVWVLAELALYTGAAFYPDTRGNNGPIAPLAALARGGMLPLESFSYDGEVLVANVSAADAAALERTRQSADPGFSIDLGALSTGQEGVSGQVAVRRRGAGSALQWLEWITMQKFVAGMDASSLTSLMTSIANEQGLAITNLGATAGGGVHAEWTQVDFPRFVSWLADLEQRSGITVSALTVAKSPSGLVNITLDINP